MSSAVNNSGFWFAGLKVVSKGRQIPIKMEFEDFLEGVKYDLFSESTQFRRVINQKLSQIFSLRLKALRWFIAENDDMSLVMKKTAIPYIEQMKCSDQLSELADKIITALSLNKEVIDTIARHQAEGFVSEIPDISYSDWENIVRATIPDRALLFIDWLRCSLFIEYISFAGVTIYEENLLVPKDTIAQLSHLLHETNQAYATLAVELNVVEDVDKFASSFSAKPRKSKGAAIFKRMLSEKNAIHNHIISGGRLEDLKDIYSFANPISFTNQ